MYFACYLYVCVCVCVTVYVCMLRVFWNTVCWRRAPRTGQACLLPQSALFANINPSDREGHAHASKSSQTTHLGSQARWSRSRCSFPDRTGRLPNRRSQRPSVYLASVRPSSVFRFNISSVVTDRFFCALFRKSCLLQRFAPSFQSMIIMMSAPCTQEVGTSARSLGNPRMDRLTSPGG